MANLRIPVDERDLTPQQVERVDARRRRGQLSIVIGVQALIVTGILSLWVGQDLTYSPGLHRPIFFWACITAGLSAICLLYGLAIRGGKHEFMSY